MSDISDEIESNATGPKRAVVDGAEVEQHSLREQIAADEYLEEKAANTKRKLPIRLAKLRPGGTT